MNEFQNFLTLVLQAMLPILASFVTGAILVAVKHFVIKAKSELGASQYMLLYEMVRTGVLYAEQSGLTGAIENAGFEKKREAINFVVRQLDAYGLNHVNVDQIGRLIESAVHETFVNNKNDFDVLLNTEPVEVILSPDKDK